MRSDNAGIALTRMEGISAIKKKGIEELGSIRKKIKMVMIKKRNSDRLNTPTVVSSLR